MLDPKQIDDLVLLTQNKLIQRGAFVTFRLTLPIMYGENFTKSIRKNSLADSIGV